MSRCDSAAIVSNTSELLPEPETPVNTVSRRLGISTLMSLRLLTRAPWTRIRSWLSASGSSGDRAPVLVAVLIGSPSVDRASTSGGCRCSAILQQTEDVAMGVGEGGHETAGADVVRGLGDGGPGSRHLGELRLDVGHVPVGDRRR